MTIPYSIAAVSTLIWLFPPLRQYGSKYFLFFILIAIQDPIAFILWKLLQISPSFVYPTAKLFFICSLLMINRIKIVSTIIFSIMFMFILPQLNTLQINLLNSIMNVVILIIIINDFVIYIVEHNAISLFYIFLITHVISLVLKFIIVVTDISQGLILFYITTFFQIFFGIIFSFVNVNTKVFPITKKGIVD